MGIPARKKKEKGEEESRVKHQQNSLAISLCGHFPFHHQAIEIIISLSVHFLLVFILPALPTVRCKSRMHTQN